MRAFLVILFIATNPLIMAQTRTHLKLSELEGKWLVVRSNFPMWLKGNKTNPSFNYSVTQKGGKPVLLDKVIYTKKAKTKSIVGYDKPVNEMNNSFVWRGKGILCFLKSKWSILHVNTEQQWMIIHFKKTLFTPEGYDVISKSKNSGNETEKEILKKLSELGIEEKLTIIYQH